MRNYFIKTPITNKQIIDSGMALTLILLLIGMIWHIQLFFSLAIAGLIINMVWPKMYYPFAVIWFSLSNIIGSIVSKIILSIIFFVIISPISLIRRIAGKDPLRLRQFKTDSISVMVDRMHEYTAEDLEKPY